MTPFAKRDLERQRYWQGQRLESRDLDDQLADEAQRRWWHNRAIHNAYGVVSGYLPKRDENGELILIEDAVCISSGLAYDCFGRALELLEDRPSPLPAAGQSGGWTLLVSAATPNGGEPELRWRPTRKLDLRHGVPLLRLDEELSEIASLRPPAARPLARPRIGHGATVAGKTAWRDWQIPRAVVGDRFSAFRGIEVTIDTSAAGFTEVPCYFAWLQGGSGPAVLEGSSSDMESPPDAPRFIVPVTLQRVTGAAPESFVFSLWDLNSLEGTSDPAGTDVLLQLARRQLSVCWLGVEQWSEDETGDKPTP